jgi:hypothetical protein
VQYYGQNRAFRKPLLAMTLDDLRANNHHKACEAGCALGCACFVSHAFGNPLRILRTSLPLVVNARQKPVATKP